MTGVPTLDLGACCGVIVIVVFRVCLCLTRHRRKRVAGVKGRIRKKIRMRSVLQASWLSTSTLKYLTKVVHVQVVLGIWG